MELDFHGYRLSDQWQKTTEEQRDEVVRFWLAAGVIQDEALARERSQQLITTTRTPAGDLAGVSTAYVAGLGGRNVPHYFYRMFIRPQDRRAMLMSRVLDFSRDILRQATPACPGVPVGMVFVTENLKIMRPGIRRHLQRHGYRLLGRNSSGQEVWRVGFFDPAS